MTPKVDNEVLWVKMSIYTIIAQKGVITFWSSRGSHRFTLSQDDGKDEELGKAVMPYDEVSAGAATCTWFEHDLLIFMLQNRGIEHRHLFFKNHQNMLTNRGLRNNLAVQKADALMSLSLF